MHCNSRLQYLSFSNSLKLIHHLCHSARFEIHGHMLATIKSWQSGCFQICIYCLRYFDHDEGLQFSIVTKKKNQNVCQLVPLGSCGGHM
jgi:hypothetical protein